MKRVYIYTSKLQQNGKLLAVEDSFEDFLGEVALRFQLPLEDIRLFTSNGCEIHDVRVIRDNEKIYINPADEIPKGSPDNTSEVKLEDNLQTKANKSENTSCSDWITLNVGGKHFTTTRSTLLAKEPQSMLARMFADDKNVYLMNPSLTDSKGAYLIDRSPQYFEPILNYLRHGNIVIDKNVNPRGVLEEAVFYGIETMIPQLNHLINESQAISGSNTALTRMDVVHSIIMCTTLTELRFQGVNLSGADLTRLDLRSINFKYACLSRCNLTGANLSHCCLERADLSYANLEGAHLLGVKALCANMEGAILKGCNMDDPAGSKAIMEGVNLKVYNYTICDRFRKLLLPYGLPKGANLEGSNMAGVNLRVATLKNANLQNCDLRTAVLAGADLECCDLSGSDLHEANLRGANLKDAAFELMLTPLHMSQTIR